jgi:eukaryotic-like serine/threonine-protein kinase
VGSLAVVDADRVIQRAMMKSPRERYQSAEDMARDLRNCLSRGDLSGGVVARATTRLMVLPFRVLRPDPSVDFLAFSLPDAIIVSLSGLESLVVRSSLAAAAYANQPDLRALATDAAVDAVVTGSLLQAGGLVRLNIQVVEVPEGTVLWSQGFQVPLEDMFQIQDSVCSAIVEALALPLSSRERRLLRRDVPSNSEAYAHYLRANRLSSQSSQWTLARDAYQQAVEADPSYAPAWARYGRCLRIMSKYSLDPDAVEWRAQAEEAFQRAFRINPDLSLAHNLYTFMQVESGHALDAVVRLLGRVRESSSDPELYAGLVHACRYVGLLDASIAAYQRARRLDPAIRTTVAHSYFMRGDYEKAMELDRDEPRYLTAIALVSLGRTEEAIEHCRLERQRTPASAHLNLVLDLVSALTAGDRELGRATVAKLMSSPAFYDPEGLFYWADASATLGDHEAAIDALTQSVDGGFPCPAGLETTPAFHVLRGNPRFDALVASARAHQAVAIQAFAAAGGHRLLGLPRPDSSHH